MALEHFKVFITNITKLNQEYDGYGIYKYHIICDCTINEETDKNVYTELIPKQYEEVLKNGYYLIEKRG